VRKWLSTMLSIWHRLLYALGAFLEEARFRVGLAASVLLGRMPAPVEMRWWNRAIETPSLVEVHDWINERKMFSVLVWPSLQVPEEEAGEAHAERLQMVKDTIARGAAEQAWSLMFYVDDSLSWDHERKVWVGHDGFAYAPHSSKTIKDRAKDKAA
jgi:hypothetical protein